MNVTQISLLEKHLHAYTRRPGQNAYGSIVYGAKIRNNWNASNSKIDKQWYSYSKEYYAAMKSNDIYPCA